MSTLTTTRVFNFSAGPAVLPISVLEEIQADLVSYKGTGMSVMEMSHRGKTYIAIQQDALARLRSLLSIPDDYEVLLLQGGSRLQNVMIPMNLLTDDSQTADYVVTGFWGKSSSDDVSHFGKLNVAYDGSSHNYSRLPTDGEIRFSPGAAYVHATSNETIHGVQFADYPATGSIPAVIDCSSDFMSRPIDVSQFGIVYACAQKNAGIAGVTVVIIRRGLLERSGKRVPGYLNYQRHAQASDGMLNTPPTFAIYVLGLVCKWLQTEMGGLETMHRVNAQKAGVLYDVLDQHSSFYRGHAAKGDRSQMNVVFFTPSAALDDCFVAEAKRYLLSDLKGHRVLGGLRASIYNAMPLEGVQNLAQFMDEFARKNG